MLTKYEDAKVAYEEILTVMNKHKEVCPDELGYVKDKFETNLLGLQLRDVYGYNIKPTAIYDLDWTNLSNNIHIGKFGVKTKRTISWEDNGKQPGEETLLSFNFSTGAYMFGRDYPVEIFQQFFLELKSYNPKYIDSHNHCLYFAVEDGAKIYNDFKDILEKYIKLGIDDANNRRVKKLKEELARLEEVKK